jgi:hypothetical protein
VIWYTLTVFVLSIMFCKYLKPSNTSMAKATEMILTYTVRGGHKAHDKLITEFYETSLVDAFDC